MRLLPSREVARILGISTGSLANLRSKGAGPPGWESPSETVVLYREDAVEAWLRERAAGSAARREAARERMTAARAARRPDWAARAAESRRRSREAAAPSAAGR